MNLRKKLIPLAIGASLIIPNLSCSTNYFVQLPVPECTQGQDYSCEELIAHDGTMFRTEYFAGENKPVIVGAHGFTSTGGTFAKNLPNNEKLMITFPSNPGSDFGTDHSIEYDAKIFRQMINHNLGGILKENNYIIAGNSRGGFVALQDAVNTAREMKAQGLEDNVGRIIVASQDKQPNSQGFIALGGLVGFLNSLPCFNTGAQADSYYKTLGFNLREELKETTCNFVFICGGKDPLMDSVKEAAENLGARAHYHLLPEEDHWISPDELTRIIKEETPFLMQTE